MPEHIGEVIAAATTEFQVQVYELHNTPPLGSLVKTADGDVKIYALVAAAETGSIDPGRQPIARGQEETDEADLFHHHPQLSQLLRTTFRALVLGHTTQSLLRHYLPPRPARVHGFVYLCPPEEIREFSQPLDFLHPLISVPGQDEIIAAFLRRAASTYLEPETFLLGAGKELAILLADQPQRLNALLKRIKP
ncbi:MAG: hypothetical protein HY664_04245 [Chloroflexi bacterium]|nr:hypothetical protein [Chloroflexota bacterium]